MDYTSEVDKTSGICLIRASGTIRRPEDSFVLMKAAGDAARDHGVARILFDLRQAGIVGTTIEAYDTVINPEKFGISRRFRIGIVYSVITKDEQFMENAGFNRGAIAFRIFDDFDAAREWIAQ